MKTLIKILQIILVTSVLIGGFLLGRQCSTYKLPEGKELVTTAFLDSIKSLKPEVIVKDSLIFKDSIVYRDRPIPSPKPLSPEINLYIDSIVNDSTHLIIKDQIKGSLINREIEFKRAVLMTEIRTPYPVIVEREVNVYTPPFSIYGNVGMGGNKEGFMGSLEIGVITKRNTILGGQVLTDFNNDFYVFKIGKVFSF